MDRTEECTESALTSDGKELKQQFCQRRYFCFTKTKKNVSFLYSNNLDSGAL